MSEQAIISLSLLCFTAVMSFVMFCVLIASSDIADRKEET